MKRRKFGLMGAGSVLAMGAGLGVPKKARAALTAADAARLKGDLTPFGGERAGNADGSIPAWTGENLPLPPGSGPWGLMPDFFASDAKIVSINASNMAEHRDRLSDGIVGMMQKYPDFRIDVYPTHRTAIGTQEIYDNTAANVTRTVGNPKGFSYGISGSYGGPAFPIPDQSNPNDAGAQIMWNHLTRWQWLYYTRHQASFTMVNGVLTQAAGWLAYQDEPYYYPGGSPDAYTSNGTVLQRLRVEFIQPSNLAGEIIMEWVSSDPLKNPERIWEYLVGEGRIRKAPELEYDTPESADNDIVNYDENAVFFGSLDEYDWKLVGKKEIYVPYNNNKIFLATPEQAFQPLFVDPDLVRWELHRVWVVDATLHSGKRNVLPHRRYYFDEDTWHAVLNESFDANGNLWRVLTMFMENRPDIPSTGFSSLAAYDLRAGQYAITQASMNVHPLNSPFILTPIQQAKFDPQSIATNAQY